MTAARILSREQSYALGVLATFTPVPGAGGLAGASKLSNYSLKAYGRWTSYGTYKSNLNFNVQIGTKMIQASRDFVIGSYIAGFAEGFYTPWNGIIPYSGSSIMLPYDSGRAMGTIIGNAKER